MEGKKTRNPLIRFLIPLIVSFIIILSWFDLPIFFKILVVIYALFRVGLLALEMFICPVCWLHVIVAGFLVAFAFAKLPGYYYIGALLFVWFPSIMSAGHGKR